MIEMSKLCPSEFVVICEYGSYDRGATKGLGSPGCSRPARRRRSANPRRSSISTDGAQGHVDYPSSALDD